MISMVKLMIAGGVGVMLIGGAHAASAPVAPLGEAVLAAAIGDNVVKVQRHDRRDSRREGRRDRRERRRGRGCRRDRRGWYRLDRSGRRVGCRRWRGRGRRPDHCVKFGPIWFC